MYWRHLKFQRVTDLMRLPVRHYIALQISNVTIILIINIICSFKRNGRINPMNFLCASCEKYKYNLKNITAKNTLSAYTSAFVKGKTSWKPEWCGYKRWVVKLVLTKYILINIIIFALVITISANVYFYL